MTPHIDIGHALRCALATTDSPTLRQTLLAALDAYRPAVGDVVRVSSAECNNYGVITAVSNVKMQVRFEGKLYTFAKFAGGYRCDDLCADFRY